MKTLLVGEDNPYGSDPRYALYPKPEYSAGGRLCELIMKMSVKQYIGTFDRVNLCSGKWSMPEARAKAKELWETRGLDQNYVLLGSKVCKAFDMTFTPFEILWRDGASVGGGAIVTLPHPSGRNRMWNEPGSLERAHRTLQEAEILPMEY